MSEKTQIRREMLERRRAMDAQAVARLSAAIMARFCDLEAVRNADQVLTYIASKDNEVDTKPMIERFLAEGRELGVPVAESGGILSWRRIESMEDVQRGRFGILEPDSGPVAMDVGKGKSVCAVPGVAFDITGRRIGYGGGYFDRFLSEYAGIAVGLAYDFQVVPSLPHEAHDCMMDAVLTQTRLLRGNRNRLGVGDTVQDQISPGGR